eukprot:TCONS_00027370-protein
MLIYIATVFLLLSQNGIDAKTLPTFQSTTAGQPSAPNTPPLPPTKVTKENLCGQVPKSKALGRIIAGTNALRGSWPWQVVIKFRDSLVCGGVLIAPTHVLTAAHCFQSIPRGIISLLTVTLGDHRLNKYDSGEQNFTITKIDIHEHFSSPTIFNNDIALLTLNTPARFNEHIQPVCLPDSDADVIVNRTCYVTGWGRSSVYSNKMSNSLQQTRLTTLSHSECVNKNNQLLPVSNQMFCAAQINPQLQANSACHGDSGGPLMCKETDGSWTLNGLVSWGSAKCDTQDGYTVFVKVSKFIRWTVGKQIAGMLQSRKQKNVVQ